MASLFDPVAVADLSLANRMVMAPLTRSRAGQGNVPTALMATYYSQRARGISLRRAFTRMNKCRVGRR